MHAFKVNAGQHRLVLQYFSMLWYLQYNSVGTYLLVFFFYIQGTSK